MAGGRMEMVDLAASPIQLSAAKSKPWRPLGFLSNNYPRYSPHLLRLYSKTNAIVVAFNRVLQIVRINLQQLQAPTAARCGFGLNAPPVYRGVRGLPRVQEFYRNAAFGKPINRANNIIVLSTSDTVFENVGRDYRDIQPGSEGCAIVHPHGRRDKLDPGIDGAGLVEANAERPRLRSAARISCNRSHHFMRLPTRPARRLQIERLA